MCGIVGFVSSQNLNTEKLISDMSEIIKKRGPDGHGIWIDHNVALGHRRLSILDLSENGNQPMLSKSGRYIITFNGEIYNHILIRNELSKINDNLSWNGTSDTETLLEAIEYWGLEKTLKKIEGMFAFGIWDKKENKLHLARDIAGEKPLYYYLDNDTLIFSSSIKAIKIFPGKKFEINNAALNEYFEFGYITAPSTIFNNIKKLEAASYITLKRNKNEKLHLEAKKFFWDAKPNRQKSIRQDLAKPPLEDQLDTLLTKSISNQKISDVPIGTLLSGGVDSSLVTSILSKVSTQKIETFTVGFNDEDFNEAHHAKKISKFLGTSHNELYITDKNASNIIEKMSDVYDEPFSDSSQIPMVLISKFVSSKVKVVLAGDGADELFLGYPKYNLINKHQKNGSITPDFLLKTISYTLEALPNFLIIFLQKELGLNERQFNKMVLALKNNSIENLYKIYSVQVVDKAICLVGYIENFKKRSIKSDIYSNNFDYMSKHDFKFYLPDDLLFKVDRSSMYYGLEVRSPFLDKEIVEFAFSTPISSLRLNNQDKGILLKLLKKYLPQNLFDRPKAGFSIPMKKWLLADLNEWAEHLLDPKMLKEQGILDPAAITSLWAQFKENGRDPISIWNILMFQNWYSNNT